MKSKFPFLLLLASLLSVATRASPPVDAGPDAADAPALAPSRWQVKAGAPPGVALVLERATNQRRQEFHMQVRRVEEAEKDLNARKAGRVVRELKAPEGWRAVPRPRGGGSDYAFKTPQIKGREVVKAEAVLEHARRRLAEINHPDYLAKPVLAAGELETGAVGTVTFTIVQQVSGTEAVVRLGEPSRGPDRGAAKEAKELYLSDFPARDYSPGMVLRDWTIEVVGTKAYEGDNGRPKAAPHAKPLDWRKWIELRRGAERR